MTVVACVHCQRRPRMKVGEWVSRVCQYCWEHVHTQYIDHAHVTECPCGEVA